MLGRVAPVDARPVNSSTVFGGRSAASTRTGDSIKLRHGVSAHVPLRGLELGWKRLGSVWVEEGEVRVGHFERVGGLRWRPDHEP